jgi:4-carboxymuconolactone decarboxylase
MTKSCVFFLEVALGCAFLAVFGAPQGLAQQASGVAPQAQALPPDVYPESFARIPRATRDAMPTEEEKEAYDRVVGPSGGRQSGPIGTVGLRLHLPIAAEKYRDVIVWIRERGGLEPRYAELAILVATREAVGAAEWLVHERGALRAGVSQDVIELVRNQKDATRLPEKDEVIIRFAREMIHAPKVSSKTFADAVRNFGQRGTLALAHIVSHYVGASMLLRAYDMHVGPDEKAPFSLP